MSILTRLRFVLRRRSSSALDDELRFHIEQATEAHRAAGMSADEAHRRALIDFGGVESARE